MYKRTLILFSVMLCLLFTACGNVDTESVNTQPSADNTTTQNESVQPYRQTSDVQNMVSDALATGSVIRTYTDIEEDKTRIEEILDNGVEVTRDENGEIVIFNFPIPETPGEPIKEEDAEGIARNFARYNITSNIDKYVVYRQSYGEGTECYSVQFRRYYNDYLGFDFIDVEVYYDGTIRAYIAKNVDSLEGMDIPEIDRATIEQEVDQIMTKEKDVQSYEITGMGLVYEENNRLQMLTGVKVIKTDGTEVLEQYYIDIE